MYVFSKLNYMYMLNIVFIQVNIYNYFTYISAHCILYVLKLFADYITFMDRGFSQFS